VLYKLVEERPPNGYAMITKESFFKLIPAKNAVSFTFCDAEGNVSGIPRGITGEYNTGNKILSITVENIRGYALPSTGGIGTHLYILCGLILVLGPIVYGFSLRREYGRRSKK
jgi:LPXTG-motif cell wall-anchored protein